MNSEDFFDLSLYEHQQLFKTAQNPWESLNALHDYLISFIEGNVKGTSLEGVSSLSYFEHPELIIIGEGTVVEPGAFIRGPCVIGKDCIIRHGAYIRGDVLIGDGCVIGHTTELKASILLNGVKAPHFAFVGDSIIGNNVNLGAGVKCANFRLDGKEITIRQGNKIFKSGMRKLGAIIGDGSTVGCNTVLNPGTLLGKDVGIYPGKVCGGFYSPKTIVK